LNQIRTKFVTIDNLQRKMGENAIPYAVRADNGDVKKKKKSRKHFANLRLYIPQTPLHALLTSLDFVCLNRNEQFAINDTRLSSRKQQDG